VDDVHAADRPAGAAGAARAWLPPKPSAATTAAAHAAWMIFRMHLSWKEFDKLLRIRTICREKTVCKCRQAPADDVGQSITHPGGIR
jgi:hypothetical protein